VRAKSDSEQELQSKYEQQMAKHDKVVARQADKSDRPQ